MIRRKAIVGLVLVSTMACSESSAPDIPGLDPNQEVEVVEAEPPPNDDSFVWTHAVQVGDLPQLNIGHPTAQFLEDAARVEDDPNDYVCFGEVSGSAACEVEDPGNPSITGLTFGRPGVMAWSWVFVPDDAVAVRFIDQDAETTWQRPVERMVVFPDTVEDPDGSCPCRFDAIGANGALISSVDIDSSIYIDD